MKSKRTTVHNDRFFIIDDVDTHHDTRMSVLVDRSLVAVRPTGKRNLSIADPLASCSCQCFVSFLGFALDARFWWFVDIKQCSVAVVDWTEICFWFPAASIKCADP